MSETAADARTRVDGDHVAGTRAGDAPGTLVAVSHDSLSRIAGKSWRQQLRAKALLGVLVISDLALAGALWGVAYLTQLLWGSGDLTGIAASTVPPIILAWIGLRAILGLYPGYGLDAPERLRRHTYSVVAALALTAVFAMAYQFGHLLSRLLLVVGFAGILFAGPFAFSVVRDLANRLGVWGKPVVVCGSGATGIEMVDLLQGRWQLGYRPAALFQYRLENGELAPHLSANDSEENGHATKAGRSGILPAAISEMAFRQGVDTLVIAMPHTRREQISPLVQAASTVFKHVIVIPNLGGITNSAVVARDLAGTFGVEIKYNLLDPWSRRVKRLLDLVGAALGAALLSPVFALIAAFIKLDSSGPVFYGHRRVGEDGDHFMCWKFRTMRADADKALERHLAENPDLRAEWEQNQKLENDPRVTRVGRLLRKTSLDEFPQLWNVLTGQMSLIGPRPIVDAEIPRYAAAYALYKRIKPGMSGFWQVNGRSDTSYDERVKLDSYYVRNWSVWIDLCILAQTVRCVLFGRGAR